MKKFLSLILVFALGLSMVACGHNQESSKYKIYYLNTEKTGIIPIEYEYKNADASAMVEEAIEEMHNSTDNVEYIPSIPSGVQVKEYVFDENNLSIYLEGDYAAMDMYTEILVRAAIVKTLTMIDGVSSVTFYLNGEPLKNSNDDIVGAMTANMFVDDFGQETDSLFSTTLTLYFASADGASVVAEKRQVYYSRSQSPEKLIMDELMDGPVSEDLLKTIPDSTKINSISVSDDGVCIVNFDSSFETAVLNVTENATIYSIVNSLTELDTINQVQILVNGEMPHLSNLDVDLSEPLARNETIINQNSKKVDIELPEGDESLAESDPDQTDAGAASDENVEESEEE
ncbi:MAG: GerMN domain-containing protein [Pseudobutyrivibrio sp.]|nr:GerMN domain-containing protein [Pseudobutyrivibrio sp.]